jgi:hypothetical protein
MDDAAVRRVRRLRVRGDRAFPAAAKSPNEQSTDRRARARGKRPGRQPLDPDKIAAAHSDW